jgi:CBS-domain-containing membrane protein
MKVRDIMTAPAPSVTPDAPVAQVAQLVLDHGLPGIPVMSEPGRLLGVVTERDLVAKHANVHLPVYIALLGALLPVGTHHTDEDVRHILAVTASEIMTPGGRSIAPEAEVDDAATVMAERDSELLTVMDAGRLVGLLTRRDIIRLLVIEESDAGAES